MPGTDTNTNLCSSQKATFARTPNPQTIARLPSTCNDFSLPFPSILAQRQFLTYRPPPLLGDLVQFLCLVLVCFQGLEEHAGVEEAV